MLTWCPICFFPFFPCWGLQWKESSLETDKGQHWCLCVCSGLCENAEGALTTIWSLWIGSHTCFYLHLGRRRAGQDVGEKGNPAEQFPWQTSSPLAELFSVPDLLSRAWARSPQSLQWALHPCGVFPRLWWVRWLPVVLGKLTMWAQWLLCSSDLKFISCNCNPLYFQWPNIYKSECHSICVLRVNFCVHFKQRYCNSMK